MRRPRVDRSLLKALAMRIPAGAGIHYRRFPRAETRSREQQGRGQTTSAGQLRRTTLRARAPRAHGTHLGENGPARTSATREFFFEALPPELPTNHAAPGCSSDFTALTTSRRALFHQFFACQVIALLTHFSQFRAQCRCLVAHFCLLLCLPQS